MIKIFLALAACLFAALEVVQAPANWQSKTSRSFEIFTLSNRLEPALIPGLEEAFAKIKPQITLFASWISQEKIKIYIYPNEDSYIKGEFNPPAWSLGVAIPDKRAVATYKQENSKQFRDVVVHEITHLLFQDFFQGDPPRWLTEGYARFMESKALLIPRSVDDLSFMKKKKDSHSDEMMPLGRFFQEEPGTDTPAKRTSLWYNQAYSLVNFLYAKKPSDFKRFCEHLKEGKSLEEALADAYRIKSLKDLETAWRFHLKAKSPL